MKFSARFLRSLCSGLAIVSCVTVDAFIFDESHRGASATPSARAASSSSPQSQENLSRCIGMLKTTEAKRISDPKSYVLALANAAAAKTQCDREIFLEKGGANYSEEGDRYFKQAVELYSKNKWDKQDSDEIATVLYGQLKQRSPKVVESTFEELFKASEQHVEGKFERHDVEICFALIQGEPKLPIQVQQKLLERAIEIRRGMRKNENWRLAPLYDNLALCFRTAGNNKGAEVNFLRAIDVLEPDPIEQARALVTLARFYVENNMFDKADGAWRRAAALAKQKRLVLGTEDYLALIRSYTYRQQSKRLPSLFDMLITNGDEFMFVSLDPLLVEFIDKQIKIGELESASNLLKKRIAGAPDHGAKPGSEIWKIKLSNIYLSQGKTAESQALFNQAIASLEKSARPTTEYKSARAKFLENMGMPDEARALIATMPKNAVDITLPACLVVKDKIDFGRDSNLTSFDSTDENDYILRAHGGSGGAMHINATPPEGDGSSILCLGSITGSDLGYYGTIYCNNSTVTQRPNGRARMMPLTQPFAVNDGIDAPLNAKTVVPLIQAKVKMLERGDYNLHELGELTIRPQTSSAPIRIFLQDSPDDNEFVLSLRGIPVSFKQFQVWYKGTKTIKLSSAQGLIYAPNATVELVSGGFLGVIVARDFKCKNNASVFLDRGVINKSLTR